MEYEKGQRGYMQLTDAAKWNIKHVDKVGKYQYTPKDTEKIREREYRGIIKKNKKVGKNISWLETLCLHFVWFNDSQWVMDSQSRGFLASCCWCWALLIKGQIFTGWPLSGMVFWWGQEFIFFTFALNLFRYVITVKNSSLNGKLFFFF